MTIAKAAADSPDLLSCLINLGSLATPYSADLQSGLQSREATNPDLQDVQLPLHILHNQHVL